MKVRGKRPALEAKQFEGTESGAKELADFIGVPENLVTYVPAQMHIIRWPHDLRISKGSWAVRDHDGLLLVLSDDEFHKRYEPAE